MDTDKRELLQGFMSNEFAKLYFYTKMFPTAQIPYGVDAKSLSISNSLKYRPTKNFDLDIN